MLPPPHLHTGKLRTRKRKWPMQIFEICKASCPANTSSFFCLSIDIFVKGVEKPHLSPGLGFQLNLFTIFIVLRNMLYSVTILLSVTPVFLHLRMSMHFCGCTDIFFLQGVHLQGLGSLSSSPHLALGWAQRCSNALILTKEGFHFPDLSHAFAFNMPWWRVLPNFCLCRVKFWCDYGPAVLRATITSGEECHLFLWWSRNLLQVIMTEFCICYSGMDCCDRFCMNANYIYHTGGLKWQHRYLPFIECLVCQPLCIPVV